ncbi:hypothetical protein [Brevibacillus brevis]|uniref:hypothetical protein n=1 Tax=Brevibacillus brevis TaxID=1393 RepID=UPI001900C24C|nr:hypothetical protein [Brevibacillus brevis]
MRYRKLFHPQKKSPNVYDVAMDNVFQNLTDHQIKATGGDSGTEYKNVFVSDEIPSITEKKVLDAI